MDERFEHEEEKKMQKKENRISTKLGRKQTRAIKRMEIREQIWVYPFGMHNPKGDEPFCVELNQSSHTGPGDMHLTRNRQFEKDQRQGRIEN